MTKIRTTFSPENGTFDACIKNNAFLKIISQDFGFLPSNRGILGKGQPSMTHFSPEQQNLINLPLEEKIFLEGKAGCGKTTAASGRLRVILESTAESSQTFILVPARTLGRPYADSSAAIGARPLIQTYNGFVQRSLEIFWPVIAETAGFAHPEKAPCFLTIETAQILMAKLIEAKLEQGYFSALNFPASRIYNQIMISLHKCAAAEFPYETYADRMKKSWTGEKSFLPLFDQAQECGEIFRQTCYKNNLLDFSIQLEVFQRHLLPSNRFQAWLKQNYRHFIFDNAEEDTPTAHHFAKIMIKACRSALVITDRLGGYRNFLGADPLSAQTLKETCSHHLTFERSYVCSPDIQALAASIEDPWLPADRLPGKPQAAYDFQPYHQYPQMIKQAATDVADLIHRQNVPPSEIVIIAPLVSDVLYTALERELRIQNIPCYIHRPSRPLISENDTKSLLTLVSLIHPEWGVHPRLLDIVQMLQTFIPALDPIRGHILVSRTFKEIQSDPAQEPDYEIKPFSKISPDAQKRVTPDIGLSFEKVRQWILTNKGISEAPDISLSRFFHSVLSGDGFAASGMTGENSQDLNLGIKKVIESMQKFSQIPEHLGNDLITWKDFFHLISQRMVAAQYYEDWFAQPKDSVLISLASAFSMMNRPVSWQIWLNAGSPRWWERIYGHLTNDIVLSQSWQEGDLWDAQKAYETNTETMQNQVLGLLARCRRKVLVYASELSESGQDQKSRLLYLFADLAYRFNNKGYGYTINPQQIEEAGAGYAFYPGIDDETVNDETVNDEPDGESVSKSKHGNAIDDGAFNDENNDAAHMLRDASGDENADDARFLTEGEL